MAGNQFCRLQAQVMNRRRNDNAEGRYMRHATPRLHDRPAGGEEGQQTVESQILA